MRGVVSIPPGKRGVCVKLHGHSKGMRVRFNKVGALKQLGALRRTKALMGNVTNHVTHDDTMGYRHFGTPSIQQNLHYFTLHMESLAQYLRLRS